MALSVSTSARRLSTAHGVALLLVPRRQDPLFIVGDSFGISRILAIGSSLGAAAVDDALDRARSPDRVGGCSAARAWRCTARHVERRDAQDRGVELVEREALHPIGDLGAHAPVGPSLLHDDAAVRLLDGGDEGVFVERAQRAQIDDLDRDAVSFSSAAAASRATCVIREYAAIVQSLPSRAICALPSGNGPARRARRP